MSGDDPKVLVVEDEPSLVEIYAHWLDKDYEVQTAQSGEDALSQIGSSVSLMILDRMMPGMNGERVAEIVREEGYDCMIVMATAVEPDVDLISMGADAYLTKPLSRNELLTTVSRVLGRRDFERIEREFFSLVSKRAALLSDAPESVTDGSEFTELEHRIDSLRSKLEGKIDSMDEIEFVAMLRNQNRSLDEKRSVDT